MKIAIAGLGTVGVGLIKLLSENSAEIAARLGITPQIVAVSARSRTKDRGVDLSGYAWHDNPVDLAQTDADVIIELIGGTDGDALALTKAALANKKHVITANKAMLAHHGFELAQLAEKNGVTLAYEAAVAGGIPVIKALREGFAGNKIERVVGILNGTCNYILTEMLARNLEYADVLHEAQEKGYAEADPSFDVGGIDAAHKLCLLAANAFGYAPKFSNLYVEGIDKVTLLDLKLAQKLGYKIKHLCMAAAAGARAHPALIKAEAQLAQVDGVFNAVEIVANPVGQSVLVGRGAGAGPTASAVFSDIADIALKRRTTAFNIPTKALKSAEKFDINSITSSYYLRLNLHDKAGVLEEISHVLKEQKISVRKMLQDEVAGGDALLVIITHEVHEVEMKNALELLSKLASVRQTPQLIRIYNV